MNKSKVIILSIVSVVILGVFLGLFTNKERPIKELTPEIITRLQSYPYYKKEPKQNFNQIMKESPKLAEWIEKTLFDYIVKFDSNEKFFTSKKLTYYSWNNHFVVRGVYQVKNKDGSISEQDMEFEYKLSPHWETKRELFFVDKRYLSDKKLVRGGLL